MKVSYYMYSSIRATSRPSTSYYSSTTFSGENRLVIAPSKANNAPAGRVAKNEVRRRSMHDMKNKEDSTTPAI